MKHQKEKKTNLKDVVIGEKENVELKKIGDVMLGFGITEQKEQEKTLNCYGRSHRTQNSWSLQTPTPLYTKTLKPNNNLHSLLNLSLVEMKDFECRRRANFQT